MSPETSEKPAGVRNVPLDRITPNPDQPRMNFDEKALAELAASITEHGVLQPVLVRPTDELHHYQLVAGERRWRAARLAGLKEIPAL
ncbi:MAG: ParB/RepB/Spo0J family partition protein, partial [Candidatus Limnocylindrales bacterium]